MSVLDKASKMAAMQGYHTVHSPAVANRFFKSGPRDQIAECFCADSGMQGSSSTVENAKKTFKMKELVQWVVKQLQPYQTAELADAQDRIKELERQIAQPSNGNGLALRLKSGQSPSEVLSPRSPRSQKARPVPRERGFL